MFPCFVIHGYNSTMDKYLKRVADEELKFRLETFGAVQIVGPKWCGKTTTAEIQSNSVIKLQEKLEEPEFYEMVLSSPSSILKGDNTRLLDEWQMIPSLRDLVRAEVDKRSPQTGLYILTGSTSVDESRIKHSGIGRISKMKMYPMSLAESGESSGEISLKSLFDNPQQEIEGFESNLTVDELAFALCRGGWPYSLFLSNDKSKLFIAKDYLSGICNIEVTTVDGIKRDGMTTRLLLRSYARHVSEPATTSSILADMESRPVIKSDKTLTEYLIALEKLFIIDDIPAWCPAIRSKTAIRSGVKREFTDPSIAVAALGLNPNSMMKDMKTFGFLFENLVARDLRVYSSVIGGTLSYYRDRYGLEADFVIHLDDGRFALIECKLGSNQIESGASNLIKIRDLIRQRNQSESQAPLREPDLMIVITGGKYAYRRADGVYVIPIGLLGC